MKQSIETTEKAITGGVLFSVKFEMSTSSMEYRDNVVDMLHQAIAGATIQTEVEEKQPALGFHKEDEEEE